MLTLRTATMSLGLVMGAAVGADSFAATPEEQAVYREDARKLTEQARGLEVQADASLEQAKAIFQGEINKSFGLEAQAVVRLVSAYQKWLQGGAKNQAKASIIRESARSILFAAYKSEVLALLADKQAENNRTRATAQRAAAQALLASGNDAETRAIAKDLGMQADRNDREALAFDKQAEQLRKDADKTTHQVEMLIERAVKLEAEG